MAKEKTFNLTESDLLKLMLLARNREKIVVLGGGAGSEGVSCFIQVGDTKMRLYGDVANAFLALTYYFCKENV